MKSLITPPEFPTEEDSLFDSEGEFWGSASLHYHLDGWSAYAVGYKEAADIIVQSIIKSRRMFDPLVYPIMQLYRHYLELQIKGLILSSQNLLNKKRKNSQIHDLEKLWQHCDKLLREISPGDSEDSLDSITRLIKEFTSIDPFSTAFRYPEDRKGTKSLETIEHIDILNVAKVMNNISMLLEAAEAQIDYHQSNMPSESDYY